jgi:hypothetical protein
MTKVMTNRDVNVELTSNGEYHGRNINHLPSYWWVSP